MKILYVVTQGEGGGAQKYVLMLAAAFSGQIATGAESAESLAYQAEDLGLTVHRLFHLRRAINPLEDVMALWDLVALCKKIQPDIIHLNSSKAGFLGSLIKLFYKDAKIIYTAHGFVFNEPQSEWKRKAYVFLERLASRFRDSIIAVSETDRQSALGNDVIRPEKISVIHNGIPEIKFLNKTSARQYLGLPLDKAIIGTIANLYESKGIDTLIEAASLLTPEQREYVQFAVMGEGHLRTKYERLIAKYELTGCFRLLGHRELASHYLRAFDIFVLPSRKEGFPFVLIEAMQAGLPIVATTVGGNAEAVGSAGVLIPPEEPHTLAEALLNLVYGHAPAGGIQKLQELSREAVVRSQEFTAERMIQQTKMIYDYLISRL